SKALTALGHKVVDTADAVLVAGIPVLHGRVLNLRIIERDQLNYSRMQLVLIALGSSATLQIARVATFLDHNQRALKLAGIRRVDAEVGGKLHWTANALRDKSKGAVAEYRRIQGRIEVVGIRNHGTEILLHQVGMLLYRLGKRAEDHSLFRQLLLKCSGDGNAVEHGIHSNTGEPLLFVQRNPQLAVGFKNLRINFIQA